MAHLCDRIPEEIRQKSKDRLLLVTWDKGEVHQMSMEYLRIACPCADCRGHTPDQRKLVDGKEEVTIEQITPIGHYAVKFLFSDGHDTGVYSWDVLYDLGAKQDQYWQEYVSELEVEGKNRQVCTIPVKGGCSTGQCKGSH
ncbi:MAG: DUF971 domain-containing protein [Magnetococcales bacterium]|nr:DUF971 domain-containing protein [Magnetococcales bacterium]NGZ27244.1 DUF971 domain-containing protein [Magnetococcales bacterium]